MVRMRDSSVHISFFSHLFAEYTREPSAGALLYAFAEQSIKNSGEGYFPLLNSVFILQILNNNHLHLAQAACYPEDS
jgi:hypothetical protein